MLLALGVVSAVLEARTSGQGQVVDAAIVDGTAHLNTLTSAFLASGTYAEERAANLLDGGAPYYDLYETSDGRHMSVGALEPRFYDAFVELLGVRDVAPDRYDPASAEELRKLFTETFASRTQAEWTAVFEGTDACVAPVVKLSEAPEHPHLRAREVFVERDGLVQPGPAPRFSRTRPTLTSPPSPEAGTDTRAALTAWGIADVDRLIERGAAVQV
jgi:alpha-methylacyl-CoA racemase